MKLPDRGRRAVCRRCHVVMDDHEPMSKDAEFYHPRLLKDQKTPRKCPNVGKTFFEGDAEIEPFRRKRDRRAERRAV